MTTPLTVSALFLPAPSGVGPFGAIDPIPPTGTWLAIMLQIATDVQLPTTSWQPGAPERTILAIEAVNFASSDRNISIMAQGGFLQSAASGSVTFTANDGTQVTIPVTPDPSNAAQNPTGALGWLDLLSHNVYDVDRLLATFASGPLAIANTKASPIGPFSPGTYHAGNAQTGATYSNPGSLTVPSGIIGGSGGVINKVTSISPTSTLIQTAAPHGLTVNQAVYVVLPPSSGLSFGTANNATFGVVTFASSTTFAISVGVSGAAPGGSAVTGNVYVCTIATMQADVAGLGGNAAIGTVTNAITQSAGVFISNAVGWSGSNFENNLALAARCQDSLAAASPNGPSQAYVYFAETAAQLLAASTPPYILTNGPVIAEHFVNPQTGLAQTVVASTTPASIAFGQPVTPGVSQLPVAGVSNSNPAIITTVSPNTLAPGQTMTVAISGVLGVAGVNGTFQATYVGGSQFSIPVDTTSAGTYNSGGSVEGGDLGQIDQLLQNNVVQDRDTALTVAALALPVSVAATVVVPQAYVATYQSRFQAQLQAQLKSYALGGNAPTFAVAWQDISDALAEAGVLALGQASFVREVQNLSLNGQGAGTGVAFPAFNYQAVLGAVSVIVLGV